MHEGTQLSISDETGMFHDSVHFFQLSRPCRHLSFNLQNSVMYDIESRLCATRQRKTNEIKKEEDCPAFLINCLHRLIQSTGKTCFSLGSLFTQVKSINSQFLHLWCMSANDLALIQSRVSNFLLSIVCQRSFVQFIAIFHFFKLCLRV